MIVRNTLFIFFCWVLLLGTSSRSTKKKLSVFVQAVEIEEESLLVQDNNSNDCPSGSIASSETENTMRDEQEEDKHQHDVVDKNDLCNDNNSNDDVPLHQFQPNRFFRETSCQHYKYDLNKYPIVPLSCNKYRIQTLTYNPPRCLHISSSDKNNNLKKANEPIPCLDYPKWFDGTNSCLSFNKNRDACSKYGKTAMNFYGDTASDACCACGGGIKNYRRKFRVGDIVKLVDDADCDFKIIFQGKQGVGFGQDVFGAVSSGSDAIYTMQALQDCGPDTYHLERRGKSVVEIMTKTFLKGKDVYVSDDEDLEPSFQLEMKKCRQGVPEQEFWVIPLGIDSGYAGGDHQSFIIQHALTNATIGKDMYKIEATPNVLQLRPAFAKEEKQFHLSDKYFYIQLRLSNTKTRSYLQTLVSGLFGKTDFLKPKWTLSSDNVHQLPFSMWALEKIHSSHSNQDTSEDEYHLHAKWIEDKISSLCIGDGVSCDRLEYIKKLPPWVLLNVERNAPKAEIEARFRQLSKHFYLDNKNKEDPLYEEVLVLLQAAYEGIKHSDDTEEETLIVNATVKAQLFSHSKSVVELLPSHWTLIGNGTQDERYVISMPKAQSSLDRSADSKSMDELPSHDQIEEAQVWMLFLYSPTCSFSQAVVPFLELAAEHLRGQNVRVGAYGCGIYGEKPSEKSKEKGFEGWISDQICKQFGRKETPSTQVVVESMNGYIDQDGVMTNFGRRALNFRTFHVAAAIGTAHDVWPRKFIQFAINSKKAWYESGLVLLDEVTEDHNLHLQDVTNDEQDQSEGSRSSCATQFQNSNDNLEKVDVREGMEEVRPEVDQRSNKKVKWVNASNKKAESY